MLVFIPPQFGNLCTIGESRLVDSKWLKLIRETIRGFVFGGAGVT